MLRPNEFKLRQKTAKIPEQYRTKVKVLLKQGASKKAICTLFGCNYEELKRLVKEE